MANKKTTMRSTKTKVASQLSTTTEVTLLLLMTLVLSGSTLAMAGLATGLSKKASSTIVRRSTGTVVNTNPQPAPTSCAALKQNILNFQGVQASIQSGTYNQAYDLNHDGRINMSDVTLAIQAKPSADVNGDGQVNLSDWTLAGQCVEPQDCTALLQNIKNFQGVQASIQSGTYDQAFDLNHDGRINLSDVIIAIQAKPSADVNDDGLVNLTDMTYATKCSGQ